MNNNNGTKTKSYHTMKIKMKNEANNTIIDLNKKTAITH